VRKLKGIKRAWGFYKSRDMVKVKFYRNRKLSRLEDRDAAEQDVREGAH